MAEAGNVNTAGCHIGCNQGLKLAITEIAKDFLTQALAHITMQRINGKAAHLHEFSQRISPPFGAHKYQTLAGILII